MTRTHPDWDRKQTPRPLASGLAATMRIAAMFCIGASCLAAPQDKDSNWRDHHRHPTYGPVPAGAVARLSIEPESWQLGDNVVGVFILRNEDTETFRWSAGGDYRGGGFPSRYRVTLVGEEDKEVPEDPELAFADFGGGIMSVGELKPGEERRHEIPIMRYVRVTQPGRYRVRAWHDFGWQVTEGRAHPVGDSWVVLKMPSEAEAAARVSALATAWMAKVDEYRTSRLFSLLRYPVYVKPLAAAAIDGVAPAVDGLVRSDCHEATLAMLDVAERAPPAVAEWAARGLSSRGMESNPRWIGTKLAPEAPQLTESEKARCRAIATARLASDEPASLKTAGWLLAAYATANEGEAILASLERQLLLPCPPRTGPEDNILDDPGNIRPLVSALNAALQRGWKPLGKDSPGASLAACLAWAQGTGERPADWIERLAATMDHPVMAVHALRAITKPPPKSTYRLIRRGLDHPDLGVRMVACELAGGTGERSFGQRLVAEVASTQCTWILSTASFAAISVGAHLECAETLVGRLLEPRIGDLALSPLGRLLRVRDGPALREISGWSNFGPKPENCAAGQAAWRRLLDNPANHEALRRGDSIVVPRAELEALLPHARLRP